MRNRLWEINKLPTYEAAVKARDEKLAVVEAPNKVKIFLRNKKNRPWFDVVAFDVQTPDPVKEVE